MSSIKIKSIISNLLWVLLYNNQTVNNQFKLFNFQLKCTLNQNEFKSEIKLINIHIQKEYDSYKYLNEENTVDKEKERYLEDAGINFRKIINVLEMDK